MDKLARFTDTDALGARRLLPFAVELARTVPERGMLGRARIVAEFWVSDLLKIADLGDPTALIEECTQASDLGGLANGLRRLMTMRKEDGAEPRAEEVLLVSEVAKKVRARLETVAETPLSEAVHLIVDLLYDWKHLAGDEDPARWLREQVETGTWPIEDAAALFVTTARTIGTDIVRIHGWNAEFFAAVFDDAFVVAHSSSVDEPETGLTWEANVEPSLDERRRRALLKIAEVRLRREAARPAHDGRAE